VSSTTVLCRQINNYYFYSFSHDSPHPPSSTLFPYTTLFRSNMGLTTWKHAPEGRILKSDVTVAKNYLSDKEIRRLERAVTGFFDYVEDLIEDEQAFTIQDFAQSVNAFLAFRRSKILEGKGQISKKNADQKAAAEYDIFNKTQKIESDFDKMLKALEKKGQDNE